MFDTAEESRAADLDYGVLCDELRCHTTDWLHAARTETVREQRRWRLRELALTRVLDERGALDDTLAQTDGVSIRTARDTVSTARALEDLPAIASVAAAGALSAEQLTQVVKVADPSHDAHWAAEAPSWSPADLAHQARITTKPTMDEARARRAARELGFWWRRDSGMLDGRFSLPDLDGALFESVINQKIDQIRPAKGQPWDTRARRGADALIALIRDHADTQAQPTRPNGAAAHLIVQVPLEGPATIVGIPLPDAMVETLRAEAKIEPVLVTPHGEPITIGRVQPTLSEKTKRVVRQRDGKCRVVGCESRGPLEIHHLWPKSWGGTDNINNLAAVCAGTNGHHPQLAPQGPHLLLGNPNNPNGLTLIHQHDLPALAQLATHNPNTRAGPHAA